MIRHNPKSICQFPEESTQYEELLKIVNFVYEPFPFSFKEDEVRSYYSLYLIITGSCSLVTDYYEYKLKKGDVFFTFPSKRYRIQKLNNLSYIYISFTNVEALSILNSLNIEYVNPIKTNNDWLIPIFKKEFARSLQIKSNTFIAKGLFYLTLSCFEKSNKNNIKSIKQQNIVKSIIRYIDKNYDDHSLSLQSISELYHYHFNYISQLFKKYSGVSFTKYLTNLRITKAQDLLANTNEQIKSIALKIGYEDTHYFEKIFKKYKGITPNEYRKIAKNS